YPGQTHRGSGRPEQAPGAPCQRRPLRLASLAAKPKTARGALLRRDTRHQIAPSTMNYFTPERWLRMQNMAQPQLVHAALEDWYRALDEYRAELKRILLEGKAYADLRSFASHVSLHDGCVLASWFAGSRLHLLVRPERPATRLVSLAYDLAGEPSMVAHTFPAEVRTDSLEWMYDEVSLLRQPSSAEEEPIFAHNILLGNGWELCIPFTRLRLGRPSTWLPIPSQDGPPAEAGP